MVVDDTSSGVGTFTGRLVDSKRDGGGRCAGPEGYTYDGEWRDGRLHGRGVARSPGGGTSDEMQGASGMGGGTFTVAGVGRGQARFRNSEGGVKTSGVGELQLTGVFQEHERVACCLGCGDNSKQQEQRVRMLENEVGKLRHEVEQLLLEKENQVEKADNAVDHILQHIKQGSWVRSLFSATEARTGVQLATAQQANNNITGSRILPGTVCPCLLKEVSVTLERPNITFNEVFCSLCPFDKIVKMEIEKRFGVDGKSAELPLSKTVSLSQLSLSIPPSLVPAQPVHAKVRISPVMDFKETDLRFSPTLGEVTVKLLHELVRSEFSISKFKMELESQAGPSPEVVAIALCVSKGMESIHRQNYMFCDLSSNNILLDSDGTPKICDFGVATKCDPHEELWPCVGTVLYMSCVHKTLYSKRGCVELWDSDH
ncbi:hypothetical protein Pelo_18597 [Pelomyxa schiedti]|nr:hypothetical protein Pelo_18597 [Pelomyxa schiedti]